VVSPEADALALPDPKVEPPDALAAERDGKWVGTRLAELEEAMLLMA